MKIRARTFGRVLFSKNKKTRFIETRPSRQEDRTLHRNLKSRAHSLSHSHTHIHTAKLISTVCRWSRLWAISRRLILTNPYNLQEKKRRKSRRLESSLLLASIKRTIVCFIFLYSAICFTFFFFLSFGSFEREAHAQLKSWLCAFAEAENSFCTCADANLSVRACAEVTIGSCTCAPRRLIDEKRGQSARIDFLILYLVQFEFARWANFEIDKKSSFCYYFLFVILFLSLRNIKSQIGKTLPRLSSSFLVSSSFAR